MSMEYKVEIAGIEYGMNNLQAVQITQPLFDKLSIGNACSAELNITFWPMDTVPKMAMIVPYCKETLEDTWNQIGVFYTDTRVSSGTAMNIIAYDAMMKAEVEWTPDQTLEFPMSMQDAVTVIADLMGVELDPRTSLNPSYTIDYPANGYTLRDVLRYIAAAHGGNWIITAEGKLLLVPLFDSMPTETNYLVTEDGDPITFGGTRILV